MRTDEYVARLSEHHPIRQAYEDGRCTWRYDGGSVIFRIGQEEHAMLVWAPTPKPAATEEGFLAILRVYPNARFHLYQQALAKYVASKHGIRRILDDYVAGLGGKSGKV